MARIPEQQFLAEMIKFFGWQKATRILGHCTLWTIQFKRPEEIKSAPEYTTEWRVHRDLKRFKAYMIAEGKWDEAEDELAEDELMAAVADRAARLKLQKLAGAG